MSKIKMILGTVALVAIFTVVSAPSASAQCYGGGISIGFGGGYYGGGYYGGGYYGGGYSGGYYGGGCYTPYYGGYRPYYGRRCW